MTPAREKPYSIMVLYAVSLHLLWTAGLLINQDAVHATAISVFEKLFHIEPVILPAIFCFVACLALTALMVPLGTLSVLLMLPQQFTLMISAYGAVHAMFMGQFGDGVQRPRTFITVDQAPAVLTAVFHTLAIIRVGKEWTSN